MGLFVHRKMDFHSSRGRRGSMWGRKTFTARSCLAWNKRSLCWYLTRLGALTRMYCFCLLRILRSSYASRRICARASLAPRRNSCSSSPSGPTMGYLAAIARPCLDKCPILPNLCIRISPPWASFELGSMTLVYSALIGWCFHLLTMSASSCPWGCQACCTLKKNVW